MIRLLLLALPVSLLGWFLLRRAGWVRPRAWAGGVGASALLLGLVVVAGEDHAEGRLVAAGLWMGVHLLLFGLLWPVLGRG